VAEGTKVGSAKVPADLDWAAVQKDKPAFPNCNASNPHRCTIIHGPGPHLLIMGDSHARMYLPMLERVARERHLTLSAAVAPQCPWIHGIEFRSNGPVCRGHQKDWYGAVLDTLDPDVIILAHRAFDDRASPGPIVDDDRGWVDIGTKDFLEAIGGRTETSLEQLGAATRKIVMIEPVPLVAATQDPLLCLSKATYLDECRVVATKGPTPLESIDRALAERHRGHVWSLDFDRQTCPYLPICDPIVDGLIVRRDGSHLTTRFSASLAPAFEKFLDDNGILR
jgi:hypothetical protein